MVRGGGFEPEKKLERNSFANDNENSAMQMGEGGGAELVPQYVCQRLYFTCQRKRFTHPGISVFPHFRRISRHDI